jgi:3-dehydroquinate dehydratase/shikimate dehydrogenase
MICVSIGRGRHRHMIAEHRFLAENGVKLVELRLDYIQGPVQVKRLLRERPCPAIVTCRRAEDGGRWRGTEEERLLVLRTAIAEGADWVDLEDDIAESVPRFGKTKRIVSHHDFQRTPADLESLHARLAGMNADVVKIATMADHPGDNLRMLEMVQSSRVPTVGLCMGEMGVPSRVLACRYGAPFTFATFHQDRVLAPGQLAWKPMRDVYRVDSITESTAIYGVIADPVAHSLSPAVHNAALADAGIDAVYLPFRVPAEDLDDFLAEAKRWPLAGLSVTIPHKQAVLDRATECDELVKGIGASNTLSFLSDGGIEARNTDATAAVESLQAAIAEQAGDLGGPRAGTKSALVLGAGGAARAVAFGLKHNAMEVTVTSRTLERAKEIADDVGCRAVDWDGRYRKPYDCIINTTPVGMHPNVNETPFDKANLRPYMIVFDTVYNPENTLLLKEARSVGCRTVTGVEMFVRQAMLQFEYWHGKPASADVIREAIKASTASHKPVG